MNRRDIFKTLVGAGFTVPAVVLSRELASERPAYARAPALSNANAVSSAPPMRQGVTAEIKIRFEDGATLEFDAAVLEVETRVDHDVIETTHLDSIERRYATGFARHEVTMRMLPLDAAWLRK